VIRIVRGGLPKPGKDKRVLIHVTDRTILRKGIAKGDEGVFYLSGADPYTLEGFSLTKRNPSLRTEGRDPGPQTSRQNGPIDEVTGRKLLDSPELRQKTAKEIGAKYGMKDPETVTMISFSGPAAPEGGYVHWGVRGMINGRMHIWQNGTLRPGSDLEDPHRYQKCNTPDAMISTPRGPVRIDSISPGEEVLSEGGIAVPVLRVSRVSAPGHRMLRLVMDDGIVLEISEGHPSADGTAIGLLNVGDALDGKRIVSRSMVRSRFGYTCDILPDSESGTYYVNGILVGSTLKE
jgi:hypothetical protein